MARIRIILILMWFALSAYGADFSGWQKSVKISFDGYEGNALTNFPVLISFSEGTPSGFKYSDFASASGGDLRFSSADKSAELNFDIDIWDIDGTSKVWVQIPELTSNTIVYAYWGNQSASLPVYATDGSTWSNGYIAVWHMGNTNTATQYDSANSYNASATGNPISANGVVAKAVDFDGTADYYNSGAVGGLNGISKATFSGWIYNDVLSSDNSSDSAIFGRAVGSSDATCIILWANMDGGGSSSQHRYSFNIGTASDNDNRVNGTIPCKEKVWQYVSATLNSANRRLYVDGLFDAQQNNGKQTVLSTTTQSLCLGTWPVASTMQINGKLDELRISSIDRSDAWIYAEWQNMASNSTFSVFGNVYPVSGSHIIIW